MKTNEGFTPTALVLILLAVLAVGGGAYYLGIKNNSVLENKEEDNYQPKLSQVEILFEDLNTEDWISPTCFGEINQEYVINTQEEYNRLRLQREALIDKYLISEKGAPSRPEKCIPLTIDFSKKTLLGKHISGGGCTIEFFRKVYNDDIEKKLSYSITVVEDGACAKAGSSMNWITVPKIPTTYQVEFVINTR